MRDAPDPIRVTVVAGEAALIALRPLLEAYSKAGYAVATVSSIDGLVDRDTLKGLAEASAAILVIGDRRRAPRTVLEGPVIRRKDGTAIPVGWLPDTGEEALARFARRAAEVHQRSDEERPVAVLGQWQRQYIDLAGRIERQLGHQDQVVVTWTSDLVFREEMLEGLQAGLSLAIYVGHGRPIGWVGYRGIRGHHFEPERGEPMGALFSLCCRTASRRRTGLSFAEAVPLSGLAAASFGAVNDTFHVDNSHWALALCRKLADGPTSIGQLVVDALPLHDRAVDAYRILGDPLAPLRGASGSSHRAKSVPVYP